MHAYILSCLVHGWDDTCPCPKRVKRLVRQFVACTENIDDDCDVESLLKETEDAKARDLDQHESLLLLQRQVGKARFMRDGNLEKLRAAKCRVDVWDAILEGIDTHVAERNALPHAGQIMSQVMEVAEQLCKKWISSNDMKAWCTSKDNDFYSFFIKDIFPGTRRTDDFVRMYQLSLMYDLPTYCLNDNFCNVKRPLIESFQLLHETRHAPESTTLFADLMLEIAVDMRKEAFPEQENDRACALWERCVWMPTLVIAVATELDHLDCNHTDHSADTHSFLYNQYCAWRRKGMTEIPLKTDVIV